jgi:hypothetical protein
MGIKQESCKTHLRMQLQTQVQLGYGLTLLDNYVVYSQAKVPYHERIHSRQLGSYHLVVVTSRACPSIPTINFLIDR